MVREETLAAPAPPSEGRTRLSGFLGERGLGKEPSFSRKKVPSPDPTSPISRKISLFRLRDLGFFMFLMFKEAARFEEKEDDCGEADDGRKHPVQ